MFTFTRQERTVILFLLCLSLIGTCVNYLAKLKPAAVAFIGPESGLGRIDINRAAYEELLELEGITPALAEKIIEYREENGPFRELAELKRVKGIGEYRFEKIKDYLTLE